MPASKTALGLHILLAMLLWKRTGKNCKINSISLKIFFFTHIKLLKSY